MVSSPLDDPYAPERLPSVMDQLAEGSHVAVLYSDPDDRDAYLIPYLCAAVGAGLGAVCVTAVDAAELAGQMRSATAGPTRRLEVLSTATTYFRDGIFTARPVLSLLTDLASQAPVGFDDPRFAVAGDLNWLGALDDDALTELFGYESALDALASGCRHTFACFYDLPLLPAHCVIDVLRTHRRVLVEGALWDSPFYRTPGRDRVGRRSQHIEDSSLTRTAGG